MQTLLILIVAPILFSASIAISPRTSPAALRLEFDHSHASWTKLLEAHVRGDSLDYEKLKKESSKLDAYLGSLEAVMPEEFASWKREQQLAFWIDAYNAYTVKRVVDAYPVESIKDLGNEKESVWQQEFIPLGRLWPEAGDRKLSLDEVENEIVRPKFKDARVHAALNCASRGCPAPLGEAFVAERLDEQLDAQVARWLADPSRNHYDRKANKLRLSKVFEWFREDFEREAGSVRAWVAARAPEAVREWVEQSEKLEIVYLDYSWKLNDAR